MVPARNRQRRRPVHEQALIRMQNRQNDCRLARGGGEQARDALVGVRIPAPPGLIRVERVAKVAEENGDAPVLTVHPVEQACQPLGLLLRARVNGDADVTFGEGTQQFGGVEGHDVRGTYLICLIGIRSVVERAGGMLGRRVRRVVHAQARIDSALAAPCQGVLFAHRDRTGRAEHTFEGLRIPLGEGGAQRLAGHEQGNTGVLSDEGHSGTFVEQPAESGIEVAAAGDDDCVHGGDGVREAYHALDGLLQRMQHLGQCLHLRQRHQLGDGGPRPVGV